MFIKLNRIKLWFHFWAYIQKNWKLDLKEKFSHPCPLQHYLQKPRGETNMNVPQQIYGFKKTVACTYYRIVFSLKLEVNPVLVHAATWMNRENTSKIPVTNRQILWIHSYEVSKLDSWKQEVECDCEGLGRGRKGELLFSGYRYSVLQDETAPEICSTTKCILLTLLYYML